MKIQPEPTTDTPTSSVGYTCSGNIKVLTKMVPVILKGPIGTVQTFALLDDSSEITIIEQGIANRLELKGPQEAFQMKTANGVSSEESCHVFVSPGHIYGTDV